MKKVISVREIIIVMISVMLIVCATEVFATDPNFVLSDPQTVSPDEYQNAKVPNTVDQGNNTAGNNVAGNNTTGNNTTGNNTKVYNTNNTTGLPQTGIEDYNIGILLIICIASAMYAYRKINDYRSI